MEAETGKKELTQAIHQSVQELHQAIDLYLCLVSAILKQPPDEAGLKALRPLYSQMTREQRLQGAIQEAIGVLEESRKSFKSKRLEILRKNLTRVLIENPITLDPRALTGFHSGQSPEA